MWNHQFLRKGAIRSPIVCFTPFLSIHLNQWLDNKIRSWLVLPNVLYDEAKETFFDVTVIAGFMVSFESHSDDSSVPPSPSGPQSLLQTHKLDPRLMFQNAHFCSEPCRKTTNRIKPHSKEDHGLTFCSMKVTSLISRHWLMWLSAPLWLASCTIWFLVQHNFKPFAFL